MYSCGVLDVFVSVVSSARLAGSQLLTGARFHERANLSLRIFVSCYYLCLKSPPYMAGRRSREVQPHTMN